MVKIRASFQRVHLLALSTRCTDYWRHTKVHSLFKRISPLITVAEFSTYYQCLKSCPEMVSSYQSAGHDCQLEQAQLS